eukprot:gnl/TRDRNA2_/TRDRNA2_181504_c0_seq1.p1 gnl/TRDRNA2_/TRDRNA2_181504_c0~~gnl/TRDRNA2_/TRDRNA2_181504_c0_seq1.p1  ORF type:complete len:723 (-),score=149.05 gnl/TRDRNA2_/TRDRNA2_181504_c0_seq1:60-1928(-)
MWRVARQKLGLEDEDPLKNWTPPSMPAAPAPPKPAAPSPTTAMAVVARSDDPVLSGIIKLEPEKTSQIGVRGLSYIKSIDDWKNIFYSGCDAGIYVPLSRWDHSQFYEREIGGVRIFSRHGSFVEGLAEFDFKFFGLNEWQINDMDEQQKSLLKAGFQTFANAKISRTQLNGAKAAVFSGTMNFDQVMDDYSKKFSNTAMLSNRVSHVLGLRGPSQTIDVGCSSSLITINMGERALQREQCTVSLSMGVCRLMNPMMYMVCCAGRMCSENGRSLTFNINGDGYLRGEAYGGAVLGWVPNDMNNLIYDAGSVTRQDGRTANISAPSGQAQQMLLRDAHTRVGITLHDLNATECQANGSQLGDPIEIGALAGVWKKNVPRKVPFILATGKTNKGHSEGASGITGFTKMCITMMKQRVAPLIHLRILNKLIEYDGLPMIFADENLLVPCDKDYFQMGVSAFGWGGSNCHLVGRKCLKIKKPEKKYDYDSPEEMERTLRMLEGMRGSRGSAPTQLAVAAAPVEDVAPPEAMEAAPAPAAAAVKKDLDPAWVANVVRETVRVSVGDLDDGFAMDSALMEQGMDSLSSLWFRQSLVKETGLNLPAALIFDHPTAASITDAIIEISKNS